MDLKLLVSLAILLIKAKAEDDSVNHASKYAAVIIGNRTTGGPNMQFVQRVMEGMQELQLRRSKFSRQGKSDGEMNKVHSTLRKTVGPKSNQTTPNGETHPALENFALEGDMIVNPSQIDQIITGQASNGTRSKRGATTDPSSYWTVGVPIPYEIDSSLNNLRSKIKAGLQFWMDHSCITFVEDPNANNRLRYYYGQGCWSYVGKQTKWPSQDISIGDGCSSLGTICHETMHAMGFYHTQSNYDRDSYIYVDYININPSLSMNFDKMTSATQTLLGVEYDYGSVMQYPPYAFAINNNLPTSMSIDPNYQNFMGQRVAPAFSDIKALNNLYKCANQCYTKATCYNNGIVNPNYCTTCICPKYFGGDQCETLAIGSAPVCNGQVIQATSSSMQYFTFTAGQGMTYAFAAKTGDCYWMIQAPVGRRIQIQMKSIDTTCMESCPWAGFEINLGKLDLYGIFTCCQSFSNSLYTSISNAVYLGAFVNFNNANMVLELCSRHCFRSQVGHLKNIPSGNRTAREAGYGEDSLVTGGGSSSGGCSACCMPGAAGPAGSPGQNGKPGRPGAPGNPGNPGRPPQQACDPITPPPCQPCNPGSPGQPGPQGQPGDAGRDGIPGRPGGDGQPGNAGPKGPPGPNGNPGSPGGPGNPGNDAPNEPASPGAPGPAGEPGPDGPPGQPGQPGSTGQPGQSGPKGPNGQDGQPGADGNPGPMGDPGNSGSGGERGICPKYCAIDGGVFFEDGTRR